MTEQIIEFEEFDEKTGKIIKRKYKVIETRNVYGGTIKILQPVE